MSYDVEPYGSGNLSPAQLHATMDPLERMVTEADNNVATVVHERFGTERKLRETAEKFRVADEAWSRAVKSVRKRSKNQGPSAEDHHELMQLGATRRSLEWQLEQYRTRHAELVEIERDLAMHQLDLQVAAEEMRVNVDTLRSQQVLQHAQTSVVQMQQTMRRLSSEIAYARRVGADEIDRGRADLYVARPRGGRLDQVARDIADELDPD